MRNLLFLSAGLALLAAVFFLAMASGNNPRSARNVFLVVWLVAACAYALATRAGRSWRREAALLAFVFGVPAMIALFVSWKLT